MLAYTLNHQFHSMPVTLAVMILTFITSLSSIAHPGIMLKLMLHPYTIFKNHEYFRVITADFVHNDIIHLAINEYLLYFVCGRLEGYLTGKLKDGELYFLAIYLGSMLFGSVITAVFNRKKFDYSGAGASGTIMGCLLSYMLLQPYKAGFYLPVMGEVNNMISAIIVIIGITVYQMRTKHPYINHEIHFFGGLGGSVITLILF